MSIYTAYTNTLYHISKGVIYPFLHIQMSNGWTYQAFVNECRVYRSERKIKKESFNSYHNIEGDWQSCEKVGRDWYDIKSYLRVIKGDNREQFVDGSLENHMFSKESIYISYGEVRIFDRSFKIKNTPTADNFGYEFILPVRRKDFLLNLDVYWTHKNLKEFASQVGEVSPGAVPISLYDYYIIKFDWKGNKVTVVERSILHKFDNSFEERKDISLFNESFGEDRRDGVNAYYNVLEKYCLENPDYFVEFTL